MTSEETRHGQSSSVDKTVAVTCPAGKVVTGGGGYLASPSEPHEGMVGLDRLEPLNSGSGFVATMREVVPDSHDWQPNADALCATHPARHQHPAAVRCGR